MPTENRDVLAGKQLSTALLFSRCSNAISKTLCYAGLGGVLWRTKQGLSKVYIKSQELVSAASVFSFLSFSPTLLFNNKQQIAFLVRISSALHFYQRQITTMPCHHRSGSTKNAAKEGAGIALPVCWSDYYNFCPSCGVDVSQFSHEAHCPYARVAH